MTRTCILIVAVALMLLASAMVHAGNTDSYTAMLTYLDNSNISGQALQGVNGVSATNMAAGDLNLQANLRVLASGQIAQTAIQAQQLQRDNSANAPLNASAIIGGQAYANGQGIASINQASGNGNAELNAVAATQAPQGIRETTDGYLSVVSASAGGQSPGNPRTQTAQTGGTRSVTVEASAMLGFQGMLQLNQIAGSGNATSNALLLSATPPSR
ncbi:hypothetical protein [Dyella sp. S184]|uniref:hypothetical protein n=1 Tax=Dyella sp. S184 TaxID=1641862 RepID=UPI00131E1F01|nr:hypothetical protein [Dyella sp. S184]